MDGKTKINLAGAALVILILLVGNAASSSAQQRVFVYVSSFGFLALLTLIFVLSIPLLARLKRGDFTNSLLANRRWIGIYAFAFALIHVLLVYNFFFNWDLSEIANNPDSLFLGLGTAAFLILAAMAATSNNTAVRTLGRNWKKLHYLAYVALILVLVHSFNVGLIFMKNDAVKIAVGALALSVILLRWRGKKAGMTLNAGS